MSEQSTHEQEWLAGRFEPNRDRLRGIAYRMLGSATDADDAVQETWLRLSRNGADDVANLDGWLTTVTSRVCLDMLRSRRTRRETPLADDREETPTVESGPEEEALLADAVGPALLVVLDSLAPAERIAFVLHDLFAVPYEEISAIIGRTPVTARQLASRARRRVQGGDPYADADRTRRREIVDAFFAASRNGDFAGLLKLLDPEVVLTADPSAAAMGADVDVRGAELVAAAYNGRARVARLIWFDGEPAAAWVHAGEIKVVFSVTIDEGLITRLELIADPARIAAAEVTFA